MALVECVGERYIKRLAIFRIHSKRHWLANSKFSAHEIHTRFGIDLVVVKILVRTLGFSTSTLPHRLMKAFQWLLQVTESLKFICPGGEAWRITIRVPVLHTGVHQCIRELAERRPDYSDIQRYGIPENSLGSIHSIATFCYNPLFMQLGRLSIETPLQERVDYTALFRYLVYLLGTPIKKLSSVERAKATMNASLLYELEPFPTSEAVCNNFIGCLKDLPRLTRQAPL